jgi:hypothetical protein
MPDNLGYTPGTGANVAADEVPGGSGVFVQRVKNTFGADGTSTDVSATTPLPAEPPGAGTATLTNVSGSASSVSLLAANAARRGAIIYNDSTAILYVKFGTAASTTSYTYLLVAGATVEFPRPVYTGVVHGIWASATGAARVTEV